jgi:hypothetical protein
MRNTVSDQGSSSCTPAPAEQLRSYVTNALRRSGYPPLQFLDVDVRDGHVYLSARVPALFLTEYEMCEHKSVDNEATSSL